MSAVAWGVMAAAAMIAAVAWRMARRSRLALAVALVATSLAAIGLLFAALGYGGCGDRGDCGVFGGALRTILSLEVLVLPVLVVVALVRAAWRRARPEQAAMPQRPRRRMRWRDIGFLAIGTVFLVAAIGMLIGGTDRTSALLVLPFAVLMLVMGLSTVVARAAGSTPELQRVEHDGRAEPATVIPGSRTKMTMLRLGMACFAVIGVVMLLTPDAPVATRFWGAVVVLFFGGGGLASALLTRGPWRLAFMPSGLLWQLGTKPLSVGWDAITGVSEMSIRGTRFLCVDVQPGALRLSRGQRWLSRANRAVSRSDVSIALEPFPAAESDEIIAAVVACAEDRRRREQLGTPASLRWFAASSEDEAAAAEDDLVARQDLGLDHPAAVDPRAVR